MAQTCRKRWRTLASAAALLVGAALATGCGNGQEPSGPRSGDTTCDGQVQGKPTVTVWFHNGQGPERKAFQAQVAEFNRTSPDVRVELVVLPETDYNDLVQDAAYSGDLPDLLDFDGPNLYSYAWSGKLRPLDSCVPPGLRSDLLPSIKAQGTYAGRLWGLGTFDSGMGLYVRPSILRKLGIRVPATPASAWTAQEFTDILSKLRRAGYRRPLDIKLNTFKDRTEFATFVLAPILWSAGADLIDRESFDTAEGVINGDAAVEALSTFQSWVTDGLIDANTADDAFTSGRSPISWVGHWEWARYTAAHPGDTAIAPLPRFGPETKTGMGSWQWGIPAGAADGDAVWRVLQFLLTPSEVRRMTQANGAIPARDSVVASSPLLRSGGPQHLYAEQLRGTTAVPRPATPAYPVITQSFGAAARSIVRGGDVKRALDRAAATIDRDLRAHDDYPQPR